jgi:hypothetical protein
MLISIGNKRSWVRPALEGVVNRSPVSYFGPLLELPTVPFYRGMSLEENFALLCKCRTEC